LIATHQYGYPQKADVQEVPKIALSSLVVAFKGRVSVSKNSVQRPLQCDVTLSIFKQFQNGKRSLAAERVHRFLKTDSLIDSEFVEGF